jgi:membrane protein required for colicin V production
VDTSVTAFDAVVLGVLLVSGLLALVRGFLRELLSVSAFIAAALGAIWMLPVLREPARSVIQPGWAADIAAVFAVFLLVYLAVTLVTSSMSRHMRGGDEPGLLDRIAGLAFGLVRGVVLLALFVIVYTNVMPEDRANTWLTQARLYPLVNSTAVALMELAPDSSQIATTRPPPPTDTSASSGAPAAAARPAPAPEPEPAEEPAYGDTARQSLDQLIGARAREEQDGGQQE